MPLDLEKQQIVEERRKKKATKGVSTTPPKKKKRTTRLRKPTDVTITPTEERAAGADVPGAVNVRTPFGGPTIQTPVITTQRRFQELRDRFRVGDRILSSFQNTFQNIADATRTPDDPTSITPIEVTLPQDILGAELRPWFQGLSIQLPFDSVRKAGPLTRKVVYDPYAQEVGNDSYRQEVGNRDPASADNPFGRFGRPVREGRQQADEWEEYVVFLNSLSRYMTSQDEDDTGRGDRSLLPVKISEEAMIRVIPPSWNGSAGEFFIGLGYEPDPDNPGFWRKTTGITPTAPASGTYSYNYGSGGSYYSGGGGSFGGSYRSASFSGLINWRIGL